MPFLTAPSQPALFTLWREVQDVRNRSAMAGVYYLLAWPLTWLFSNSPQELLLPGCAGIAISLLLLSLHLLHRTPNEHNECRLRHWLLLHWGLILATALSWGLLHAFVLSHSLFSESKVIATLSTVAFSTAIVFNFGMRKLPVIAALLMIYLPGLVVLLQNWQEHYPLIISLALYLSYLSLALNRSHQGYQRTLNMELQLLRQQSYLDQLSRTDSLTQLGNRYEFNSLFPSMAAMAQRQGQPLSLVLLDIDHFKQINDVYGHACGDECLSAFAERMRQHFRRASDALLRLGGEEFAVLMPNTQLEHAQYMADQFRQELAREYLHVGCTELSLTASIGVGCYSPEQDENAEAFFKRVDTALYQAKNAGRNSLALA